MIQEGLDAFEGVTAGQLADGRLSLVRCGSEWRRFGYSISGTLLGALNEALAARKPPPLQVARQIAFGNYRDLDSYDREVSLGGHILAWPTLGQSHSQALNDKRLTRRDVLTCAG